MSNEVTIAGGGLGGLVAAITAREQGAPVVLHEASGQLGGRARTTGGEHRVNVGPHALYRHAAFEAWLLERKLLPGVHFPSLTGLRMRVGGRLRRVHWPILKAMGTGKLEAPVDEDYRSFAARMLDPDVAHAAIGLAALPTFHPDPGALSAAFVQERIARSSQWRAVYYVNGGFGALVAQLETHARTLGVRIETGSKLASLPEGPCIIATDLPAAGRLLGEPGLTWPGSRTVQLDASFERRRRDPSGVLDLDEHVYATRITAGDATLAPKGESLVQAVAGVREGESDAAALERVRGVMDDAWRGWRERIVWQRTSTLVGGAGALDMPGFSWRDRPGVTRGGDRWLVGDKVAAPGLLSEVSFESGRQAGLEAAAALRGRRADPGQAAIHAA